MTVLRSIVYVSTASHELTEPDLETLLMQARDLNRDHDITGALLYNDGNFMQCFEGPDASMDDTYQRIRDSKRHHDIAELMNEQIAHRNFDQWHMAVARPTASKLLALYTARWQSLTRQAAVSGPDQGGFELLKIFWRNAGR